MKRLFLILLVICTAYTLAAEHSFPPEVEAALRKAGNNRLSLEAMLNHYKEAGDKEKYDAACFLVRNMVFHSVGGRIIRYDQAVDSFRQAADRSYYALIKGTTAEMQESDPLHKAIKDSANAAAQRVAKYSFTEPQLTDSILYDIEAISGGFLKKQIDHAFFLRRKVERIRKMPFADFLEYILPYRSISSYPLVTETRRFYEVFAKYLQADNDTLTNYKALGERYNRATWWLRHYNGQYPFDTYLGFPDFFFLGLHDCVDKAEYGAQVMRSCGIAAATEYNSAYRIWTSRHYMTCIPNDKGKWMPYDPETQIPSTDHSRYRTCLNIYRNHFSRQHNNPYSIAEGKEPLPSDLSDPCIEDVTKSYLPTVSLSLPIDTVVPSNHKLVYLASFQSGAGLTAVTWGVRDKTKNCFRFSIVVKDNVYFPVYCNEQGRLVPFASPFSLHSDSASTRGWRKEDLPSPTGKTVEVNLHRKYPIKPHLVEQARRNIGTVVLGSDSLNFKQADTLAIITNAPSDEWTDLPLRTKRPYRYYRVKTPAGYPHLHLAELQWLTRKVHAYSNVMHPTPLDGGEPRSDSVWTRLLDEPLEKCKWKAEYDGNVQTAPDRWPDVTLKLEHPQMVECLRYVAKNAENNIQPGHTYSLSKFGKNGWENVWIKEAQNKSLPAGQLEVGACYWLSDLTQGKEELPFIVKPDATALFPHDWVVADVEAQKY